MRRRDLLAQLRRGNATVIGVGQGRQAHREAWPKQVAIAHAVARLAPGHRTFTTIDPDGERGVLVTPRLREGTRADPRRIGQFYGQRSVLNGLRELPTRNGRALTKFEVESVGNEKPEGFWTFLPEEGLYYKLGVVAPHVRKGRPVVGYATRKRVRRVR